MSDNPYDPSGAAAAAAAAAAATPPSVPVYQTGNPFAPPADPNAVGGLGMTLGTGRSLMELGANMSAAANARIGGGFLANGTGFLGPLMAGVGQTLQQGQQDVNSRAAYNSVAAQTIGQQLKNREEQMKLPLTAAQTTQNLDWILHPEHAMQYWQQFAAPPPPSTAPGTGPGASNVSGNSPETASVTPATYGGSGESIANNPKLAPLISRTAMEKGIPPQLAYALLQQESSVGTNPNAGNNVGQITFKTANNPGYGMQPISGSDLQDPGKNVAWSLDYLKRAGEANGVTDWSNSQQWGTALRAYNGNGDPAYVEHVARWLPKGMQVYDPGLGDAAKPFPNTASAPGQGNAPTGQSKPMVIGDSIGAGLQKAGNLDGTSVQGASPEAVLGTIKTMSPDSVRGRNIILSGGSSNDTTQTGMVADQVRVLQSKGAASVSILGVGSRQDFMQARVNQQLRAIADSTGAKFVPLGATGPDNVHPADYAALLTNLQPQATTPGTQPPYQVAQAGGATAAPGGQGPVASDVGAMQQGRALAQQPSGVAPQVAQTGAPNPFGTQTGTPAPGRPPTPQENAQRQGAIHLQNAQNLTQQAGLLEQQQTQWEQQKAFFTARGIPPFVLPPRPAGDPALFRTEAANEQKTGLDLMTAAPGEAAKQAETITINRTTNDVYRGSTLIAHGGIQREILNNATGNYEWYTVGASDPRTGAILPPIPLGATADIGPKAKQGIELSTGDINQDRTVVEAENDHVIGTAQNAKAQALQLKQLAPEAFTGPMGDVRAKLRAYVQYVAPQAVSEYIGANADVAQEFKKIALMQAGTEERSNLGAKGGIRATELYLEGNPNLDMNEVANGHMANLLAVQQQAAIDYGTGSSAFYEKSRDEYPTSAAPYQRITAYDNNFNKIFNANTYSAAMSAMNDRPYATWSKGLSPAQQQAVLGIVQRTDPTQKIALEGEKRGTADDFIQRGAKIISPEDIIGNNYGIQGKLAPPAGTTNGR